MAGPTQHKAKVETASTSPDLDARAHEMISLLCKILSMRLADVYENFVRSGGETNLPQQWWFKEALKCLAEELRAMETLDPEEFQSIFYEHLWPRFDKRLPDPPLLTDDQSLPCDLRDPSD